MSIDSGRPDISGADRPDRADEQAADQQARAGDRQPAERLSREEYSDRVRARGSPLGQHDTPTRGTGDSGQPGASPDKREVPVSDHLNGRSRDPDLNTSDIASGPGHRSNIADVPKTPQPARAETAGPARRALRRQAGWRPGGQQNRTRRAAAGRAPQKAGIRYRTRARVGRVPVRHPGPSFTNWPGRARTRRYRRTRAPPARHRPRWRTRRSGPKLSQAQRGKLIPHPARRERDPITPGPNLAGTMPGIFPTAARSVSTSTATAIGCTQARAIPAGARQLASSLSAWKMMRRPDRKSCAASSLNRRTARIFSTPGRKALKLYRKFCHRHSTQAPTLSRPWSR